MAGHSHWAGIKHKKGRQDKIRSKIFSKISREITVAAKLGSKDPNTNHRLRAAIESAKESNMPNEMIKSKIIAEAFKYHSDGNIPKAIKCYQLFIDLGFEDPRVFSNYGAICQQSGQPER